MAEKKYHDYHLVDPSPWPLVAALGFFMLAFGAALSFQKVDFVLDSLSFQEYKAHEITSSSGKEVSNQCFTELNTAAQGQVLSESEFKTKSAATKSCNTVIPTGLIVLFSGLFLLLYVAYRWWGDVIKEGQHDKAHNKTVRKGLQMGMLLFIISEVMFFFAFFFSYFSSMFIPVDNLDADALWSVSEGVFPPPDVKTFDPWDLPLINTLILLLSGTTVTWAHQAIFDGNRKDLVNGLAITVGLGVIFSVLQGVEYSHAKFGFDQNNYTGNFFMSTGFHGFHVFIGTVFLAVCLFRAIKKHFTATNHLGFEFAAWYWHFVDVVWLFLFVCVYILGR